MAFASYLRVDNEISRTSVQMLDDGYRLCGLRSNGNKLRNAAFTTIKMSTIAVIILGVSLSWKRLAISTAAKLPATTDPNLTKGIEKRNRGKERAPIVNERNAGCKRWRFFGPATTNERNTCRHLPTPRANRIGRGERYSILHSCVSLVAGFVGR